MPTPINSKAFAMISDIITSIPYQGNYILINSYVRLHEEGKQKSTSYY